MRILLTFLIFILCACGGNSDTPDPRDKEKELVKKTKKEVKDKNTDKTAPNNSSLDKIRDWSAGFQISNPQRDAQNPVARVSKDGTVFVIWIEEATNNMSPAIFAAVLPADLDSNQQNRDSLKIKQLSNDNQSVTVNLQWNLSNQVERYLPSAKLVLSSNGDAHVAWLAKDGESTSIYISQYSAQNGTWSNSKSFKCTLSPCSEIKLAALANNNILLLWKQKNQNNQLLSLNGLLYTPESMWRADILKIANNVKTLSDVALWSDSNTNTAAIGYLEPLDQENDQLILSSLNLSNRELIREKIDSIGVKGSLVGTQFNEQPVLIWAGIDQYGYYSMKGAEKNSRGWRFLPQIENFKGDVGQIAVATMNDKLHIIWRDTQLFNTYSKLRSLTYSSSGTSESKLIYDLGALNPVIVNGNDGKLYLQWSASHTKYSEYSPNNKWETIKMPFCHKSSLLYPLCYNDGTQHTIDVYGDFGVSAWLESVANSQSLVIALSNKK